MKRQVLLGVLALLASQAFAQQAVVTGPDSRLKLDFQLQDGKPVYSVTYDGKTVLENSPLGFVSNIGDFSRQMSFVGQQTDKVEKTYTQDRIKCSTVNYSANKLTITLENAEKKKLDIVFQLSNNDIAFRYEMPQYGETACMVIEKEATGFDFSSTTTTFLSPQSDPMIGWQRTKPSYEEEYVPDEPVATPSKYGEGYTFPALFHVGDNWALVSETGVRSLYCASHLSDATQDGLYSIAFPNPGEINGLGSSKFQPENRWDLFYGASWGWRIKQENFMQNIDWLSDLKLRVSYAEMGNQSGIANYDGVQLYNMVAGTGAYVGDGKLSYIKTNGELASRSRSWERIKNYNVGVDFGFLNGALSGSVEAFLKKNDNMLVSITYPGILGDEAPKANAGKFKDWGFEGQMTYRGNVAGVNYYVGGTFTFARNELVDYGGTTVLKSGYTTTQQGYALNSIFGLRYGGKIQNEEQLQAYLAKYYENNGINMPSNLRVGDNMYCDENGDGVLDEKDYIYLGSDTPEISYSFNAGASYKGFDVSVIFQGSANRFVYRGIDNWTVPFRANYTNTITSSIGNVWSPENPDAYYAPYTNDANINNYNYQASSLTSQDGRYLRLKNLTIGYTFTDKLLQKIKFLQGARIYATGTDLWEYTKIKDGWDPEAARDATGLKRYPFTRNITFGVNLTF